MEEDEDEEEEEEDDRMKDLEVDRRADNAWMHVCVHHIS